MESIGVLLGVLLVFFVSLVAFIVSRKKNSFSSSDGDSFEMMIVDASKEGDMCGEIMPLNDVSEIKVALHDENRRFSDKLIEKNNNMSISEHFDNQDDMNGREVDDFSLRDGILYSIILEKRQF